MVLAIAFVAIMHIVREMNEGSYDCYNVEGAVVRYYIDIATAHKLWEEAREELGDDLMMAELHTIRAIRRIAEKSM